MRMLFHRNLGTWLALSLFTHRTWTGNEPPKDLFRGLGVPAGIMLGRSQQSLLHILAAQLSRSVIDRISLSLEERDSWPTEMRSQ